MSIYKIILITLISVFGLTALICFIILLIEHRYSIRSIYTLKDEKSVFQYIWKNKVWFILVISLSIIAASGASWWGLNH